MLWERWIAMDLLRTVYLSDPEELGLVLLCDAARKDAQEIQ